MQSSKKKIIIGMSGGVDSSVAAGLLIEQGFELIGITIKTYNYDDVGGTTEGDKSCCSLEGINDARIIANQFNFPHYVLDFTEVFGKNIIDNFIDEYMHGRTPNPCVVCNRKIKWEELIKKGMQLGADFISMGHYAKVNFDNSSGRYFISKGKDLNKDQSYMLWNLSQSSLSKTIFPIGDLTKDETRKIAERMNLKTAHKGESFEICFITDNNYERFLKHKNPDLEKKVAHGKTEMNGRIIGEHSGFPFYTIGQRKGIGVALPKPVYVTEINYKENKIVIGKEEDLLATTLFASQLNLQKYDSLKDGKFLDTKIRYKDLAATALVTQIDGTGDGNGKIKIEFKTPKRSITPGQSVVFYEGDDLVGGAIIDEILK